MPVAALNPFSSYVDIPSYHLLESQNSSWGSLVLLLSCTLHKPCVVLEYHLALAF